MTNPRPAMSRARLVRLVVVSCALLAAACGGGDPGAVADARAVDPAELARWEATAARVTITRDTWGIPHVRGTSDADAVFGALYAQAEDDFNRIEVNYLNAMGRLAEAEGESAIWSDLRMKLFIHPDSMRAKYAASPDSLKRLMDAFADGLNYFLHTNPQVTPRVLTRFEPWMALTFSEGSIGGDIESINLRALRAFYEPRSAAPAPMGPVALAEPVNRAEEPSGSNGFAIAPSKSASGHALLLINPHTSFFFRAELQMTSDEGLNAYGASTWGQFFIYQGFNERAGWMHTSSGADAIDEYAETVTESRDGITYRYGAEQRPMISQVIEVPFKTDSGMTTRTFTVYRSHHGPIVREQDGRWIAVKLMEEPVKALTQSYWRTKARDLASFRATMDLHTNSSNNTVYADGDGTIAFFHANFVPRRDARFDWERPVDGSDPATEWQGIHTVDESPLFINPPTGWLHNTNNWPFSAYGAATPPASRFAKYFDYFGENPRGIHAVRVLENRAGVTLDTLIAAAYDNELTAFETLFPPLFRDYDALAASDPRKTTLAEPIAALRGWDRRYTLESAPTSLAIYWGENLWRAVSRAAGEARVNTYMYMERRATAVERLGALAEAVDTLTAHFGQWDTPWGEINRYQRLTGDIVQPFNDSAPSIPVAFASSRWGSLAAFGAATFNGTKRLYGTRGNSFVAAVEFGPKVRARAIMAGGQSGDVNSPHFGDQAEMYARGEFRDVLFYPEELEGKVERTYTPGRR
jgi:acyl-homoserine-lactone acylase